MSVLSFYYLSSSFFFFFTDPATTEIYTLSLHDALPISIPAVFPWAWTSPTSIATGSMTLSNPSRLMSRSEEHTSELQSPYDLVCRLLLEKKKKKKKKIKIKIIKQKKK